MRSGLFWRIFSAILAATLFTVLIFTGIMSTSLQQERQAAYEGEVRLQAYEGALARNTGCPSVPAPTRRWPAPG